MTFIPVPKTARVQMIFTQQGQSIENVYHVRNPAVYDIPALLAVAGVFLNWHNTQLRTTQPSTVVLQRVIVTSLETASAPGIEDVSGLPLPGINGANQLPMNVTLAMRENTVLRGKSFRGRVYHIGLIPAAVIGSTVDSVYLAGLITIYNFLVSQLITAGFNLAVVSYRTARAFRAVGVPTDVLAFTADSTTDSQRRRLPGRGR